MDTSATLCDPERSSKTTNSLTNSCFYIELIILDRSFCKENYIFWNLDKCDGPVKMFVKLLFLAVYLCLYNCLKLLFCCIYLWCLSQINCSCFFWPFFMTTSVRMANGQWYVVINLSLSLSQSNCLTPAGKTLTINLTNTNLSLKWKWCIF